MADTQGEGTTTDGAGARSFATFFSLLGEGDANDEASEALFLLGQALQDEALKRNAQIKGSLTLKLDITCDPRGVVGVSWDVARKDPKPQRIAAALWVDKNGNLVHENPRQQNLFPREVRQVQRAVREIEDPVEVREVRAPKEV
jgi:hypothetical protein